MQFKTSIGREKNSAKWIIALLIECSIDGNQNKSSSVHQAPTACDCYYPHYYSFAFEEKTQQFSSANSLQFKFNQVHAYTRAWCAVKFSLKYLITFNCCRCQLTARRCSLNCYALDKIICEAHTKEKFSFPPRKFQFLISTLKLFNCSQISRAFVIEQFFLMLRSAAKFFPLLEVKEKNFKNFKLLLFDASLINKSDHENFERFSKIFCNYWQLKAIN